MCIHDHAIFVLSFLEYVPAKASHFEGPIKDVDNEAEDILEYFMWNQIHKPIMLDVGDELGIEFGAQMVGMMKGIYSQMTIMEVESCRQ
ncbi:hypothetical protein ACS0TY_023732 [Phlomoides rotata]